MRAEIDVTKRGNDIELNTGDENWDIRIGLLWIILTSEQIRVLREKIDDGMAGEGKETDRDTEKYPW